MKHILIISGKQGAGKTSNSKHIMAQAVALGYYPKAFKFAEIIYHLHDRCLDALEEWEIRPRSMKKDGELLQVLGTEYGRKKLGEDVWVKALRGQVDKFLDDPNEELVIIDDCRFENEFDGFPDAFKVRL